MSTDLLPTSRYPLRRLWNVFILAAVLGLVGIVYSMVNIVQDRGKSEEWILGVSFCLLFGAGVASQVHSILANYEARLEALEKRTTAGSSS